MKKIRVGSRDSMLAVIQSNIIIELINKQFPEYETELVTMKTTGDIRQDITLDKIGGRGLFVKELDRALLNGEVDITVHSLKDMPLETNEELPVIAYSKRAIPFDVLVLPKDGKFDVSRVGCSSARRAHQLSELYPNANIAPIRGNVPTRLKKLDDGEYTATLLAAAGLERLGLSDRISKIYSPSEMIPAAGQGIIAVQCRRGFEFLSKISDKTSEICAKAELSCIKALGGGCSVPAGVYAIIEDKKIHIYGYHHKDGISVKKELYGDILHPEELGERLAKELEL